MSVPIIITVPKYVDADKLMLENMKEQHIIIKGRKRRLDHLSWEEKIQRKKLKNRVAAQTSRDRKKAKLDQMEFTIQKLSDKYDTLQREFRALQGLNKKLLTENEKLKANQTCCGCRNGTAPRPALDCSLTTEPAVFTYPLPQGIKVQSKTEAQKRQISLTQLKILLAYFLCLTSQTSTQSLTLTDLKSSLKAFCSMSPQTQMQTVKKYMNQKAVKDTARCQKWWGRHQKTWNPVKLKVCAQ